MDALPLRSVVHQVLRGGFLLIDFKYIQVQVPGSTCMSLVRNEDGSVPWRVSILTVTSQLTLTRDHTNVVFTPSTLVTWV